MSHPFSLPVHNKQTNKSTLVDNERIQYLGPFFTDGKNICLRVRSTSAFDGFTIVTSWLAYRAPAKLHFQGFQLQLKTGIGWDRSSLGDLHS